MKKKIDSRIRTLIENGVALNFRSFFVIVGDKGRDQVVNLHYMLSKCQVKSRPSVLWCYKTELGFSSNRKKRMTALKRKASKGTVEINEKDPFDLFVNSTDIRYTYYAESHKILGNTFGMLVLQDFEAITPNLLARTIETVEGGGLVVLLLKTMSSLKQLYSMTMDVHQRFRSDPDSLDPEAPAVSFSRFNERFLLSLSSCSNSLVIDDELNILPISSHSRSLTKTSRRQFLKDQAGEGEDDGINHDDDDDDQTTGAETATEKELKELKESLKEHQPIGPIIQLAKTLDQAKAILTFIEAASDKNLRTTVTLTAARGRGKSAAMGLAVAAALAFGYSNVFVTSPSPENLRTFFQFVFKGFDQLQWKEHLDYELVEATEASMNRAIVRVNVFHRQHRQTIQYVHPSDAAKLSQAELVVIDEAAAIPLPTVKALLGSYLVFMASTINGYEGTGRSLSLKLIDNLRKQSLSSSSSLPPPKHGRPSPSGSSSSSSGGGGGSGEQTDSKRGRNLKEVALTEPIRYGAGDPVEKWLNQLLCLDCNDVLQKDDALGQRGGCPSPDKCSLYYVSRDTLFSFHEASEQFLQRLMALYVSSHYKNTPNDLLLLADAPAHHLFCLLGPVERDDQLPQVLCVIQVALEGRLSRSSLTASVGRGEKNAGDLIPWTITTQFQDTEFAQLNGARVVRIATHPSFQRMGYGSRALRLLQDYYRGSFLDLSESSLPSSSSSDADKPKKTKKSKKGKKDEEDEEESRLREEVIEPRADLPPLLLSLEERAPEPLHWIGTSFGLTQELFSFWTRLGMVPVYVRQTSNDITGEQSAIMIRSLSSASASASASEDLNDDWLSLFHKDFVRRFAALLHYSFHEFSCTLALDILRQQTYSSSPSSSSAAKMIDGPEGEEKGWYSKRELDYHFSAYDMKRLESYSRNLLDYHVILDLVPRLAQLFFLVPFGSIPFPSSASENPKLESTGFPFKLSLIQSAVLVGFGFQHKSVDTLMGELNLQANQVLAMFNKAIRKFAQYFTRLQEEEIEKQIPENQKLKAFEKPLTQSLADDLDEGSRILQQRKKQQQDEFLSTLNLAQYAIGNDVEFEGTNTNVAAGIVSVKRKRSDSAKVSDHPAKKHKSSGPSGPSKRR